MKAKTFENLIRKVVREEIDYALRREIKSLKEDLRDDLKPTIVEHTERLVEVPQQNSLKEKIMGKKPLKKHKDEYKLQKEEGYFDEAEKDFYEGKASGGVAKLLGE